MRSGLRILEIMAATILVVGCASQSVDNQVSMPVEKSTVVKDVAKPQKPVPKYVDIETLPFKGNEDAPITLVIFTDFQCAYCAGLTMKTLPTLEKEYVETNQLKYALFMIANERRHPEAINAAVAAYCAGEQDKFWPMHDLLFATSAWINRDNIFKHAKMLGLDNEQFSHCFENGPYEKVIKENIAKAVKLNIRATPTLYFGFTPENGEPMLKKASLVGAQPYDLLKKVVDDLIKKKNLEAEGE